MTEATLTDSEFKLLRELTYELTGISLSDSKRNLVQGRLQKRLRFHGLSSYLAYYTMLTQEGPQGTETTEFINCITTNKTDFFREPHHFDFVSGTVIPSLIRRAARGDGERRLRVWHAGCSTGEEPYTLAITLQEALSGHSNWNVLQLASDIDTNVIAHAERGIYEDDRIHTVPSALLKKYFLRKQTAEGDQYKVRQELASQIVFRQINLLDPGWPIGTGTQFDMIFCRNVVIYFDKATQKKLFERLERYLKPGGHLFIGHSESLLGVSESFESLGQTIYRLPETVAVRKAA